MFYVEWLTVLVRPWCWRLMHFKARGQASQGPPSTVLRPVDL